ncbi:Hypp2933 [Branchiostoma lanceolatum]|uniref:Hypp2933 protein n=1 Tax=Branchiostoma lanceolatum TaxID=7740 RepID=A0A8J9ZVE6_BRALA|nr:Hypp2933 [Branchiostoma lanceolatum]
MPDIFENSSVSAEFSVGHLYTTGTWSDPLGSDPRGRSLDRATRTLNEPLTTVVPFVETAFKLGTCP